jgi:hypothetical protein
VDPTTDPSNCGGCGLVCGGTCQGGECLDVVAAGQNGISSLTARGGIVYWTAADDGTVMSVPGTGGTPSALAFGLTAPSGIAVDSVNAYWLTTDPAVMSAPLSGGNAVVLAAAPGDWLALDATSVYWSDGAGGTISSVPIGGGQTAILANGLNQPGSLAVSGTDVYFLAVGSNAVLSVPVQGGSTTTLAFGQGALAALALDSGSAYYTTARTTTGRVSTVPLAGGAVTRLATNQRAPGSIAVDGENVYFIDRGNCTIHRVPVGGGAIVDLVTASMYGGGCNLPDAVLAVDAGSLYWATTTGAIMKLTPK